MGFSLCQMLSAGRKCQLLVALQGNSWALLHQFVLPCLLVANTVICCTRMRCHFTLFLSAGVAFGPALRRHRAHSKLKRVLPAARCVNPVLGLETWRRFSAPTRSVLTLGLGVLAR